MARTVRLDMTGVETYSKASEGIHTAKVTDIQEKTSQGGDSMLQFTFEVIKGDDKGSRVFDNFVLTDKALWKFKQFLQAIGMKADGKIKVDLDKLIGKVCDIEVFWDEYNGQTRAKISDYSKAGKTTSNEDDEDEVDEVDEIDEVEEEEEKPAPKKRGRKPAEKKPAKKEEPENDEDDEEWEDDEDEEEPAPKKAKKAEKKTVKKAAKKKPEPEPEDDEDEDDEWEEDD